MAREYVATQWPLPPTLIDFWRMVWQRDARTIIALSETNTCWSSFIQYWPNEEDGETFYRGYSITLDDEEHKNGYIVRHLTVKAVSVGFKFALLCLDPHSTAQTLDH